MQGDRRVVLAADHGGFRLKGALSVELEKAGYAVEDLGVYSADSVDYPDYAHRLAEGISRGVWRCGILVCGSGVGMSIAANRHSGVRAVVCSDTYTAKMSRLHNDANVLCLGERVVGTGLAWDITHIWLETAHDPDPRHARRVGKIDDA